MAVDPYLGKVRDAIKMLDRQVDVIVRFLQAMKSGKTLSMLPCVQPSQLLTDL